VTIKHPPAEIEGIPDNTSVGQVFNVAPQLALLMIAAGWARSDARSHARRDRETSATFDRRHNPDRRSGNSA